MCVCVYVVPEEFSLNRISCSVLVSRFPTCVCVCVYRGAGGEFRGENHLEERLLDQAQARASYTPPFLGSFA